MDGLMIPNGTWMKPVISSQAHLSIGEKLMEVDMGKGIGTQKRWVWLSRCGKRWSSKYSSLWQAGSEGVRKCPACERLYRKHGLVEVEK